MREGEKEGKGEKNLMEKGIRGRILQKLSRALDAVHAACDHLSIISCVAVTGSAAIGTVLPDSDLDVDFILKGPQPQWGESAWGVVHDLASNLHTCRAFRTEQTSHRLIRAVYREESEFGLETEAESEAEAEVRVDICVKWTDGLTVTGFGPEGQVRDFGALKDIQKTCADPDGPLDAMSQAVVVVKGHVKTCRPGIKSCHVELLSKHLIPTGSLARDVQMLWALVVGAGVTMTTDGFDYKHGMYAGHPEYLTDILDS